MALGAMTVPPPARSGQEARCTPSMGRGVDEWEPPRPIGQGVDKWADTPPYWARWRRELGPPAHSWQEARCTPSTGRGVDERGPPRPIGWGADEWLYEELMAPGTMILRFYITQTRHNHDFEQKIVLGIKILLSIYKIMIFLVFSK